MLRMPALRILLTLVLALGPCSSEQTTEDGVTSATSGNSFHTTVTDVMTTETSQMTRTLESSSATIDESPETSSATSHTSEQPERTDGTTVTLDSSVTLTSNNFATRTELYKYTTEEDNASATSATARSVATETLISAVTSEGGKTGSGSITGTTSEPKVTTDNHTMPHFTASSDGKTSEATALQLTIHGTGHTTDEDVRTSDVTTSDVTESHVTLSDATASQVDASEVTTSDASASDVTTIDVTKSHTTSSDVSAFKVNTSDISPSDVTTTTDVTKSHATSSDVSAFHVNTSDFSPSDVSPSDVTASQSSDSHFVQHSGAQYTTTDIIIIVVVTVVGGLIIISALVAVIWKLRIYRNLSRYFLSNGHAQEFDMAACTSAGGKQKIQTESETGVLAGEEYQPPESNFTLEFVHEPDQNDQPLFSKAADPLAAGSQAHPMVEIPLNDGIRNQGFQGENHTGF